MKKTASFIVGLLIGLSLVTVANGAGAWRDPITSGTLTSGHGVGINSSGKLIDNGRAYATDGTKLDALPSSAYATVGADGTSQTQRGRINLISGTAIAVSAADNSGTNSTDVTLNGKGYTMPFLAGAWNPADGIQYFAGFTTSAAVATANLTPIVFPKSCTLKRIDVVVRVSGTLGSNENTSLQFRLNNTTNTLITSTAQLTATTQTFSLTGQNIAIAAGDTAEIRLDSPTWGTNPTNVSLGGTGYCE